MIKKLEEHIRFFLSNKWYVISLIVSAVVGYGYQLGHGTCGIDDIVIDMYFEDGLGVAIGRWPFFYVNKIFHIAEYKPFIIDFIAVVLLMAGAILWCALIREIANEELPILCYVVFSAMFLLYSLIAEVFIYYLHNGIVINYCLVGFSLFALFYLWKNKLSLGRKIFITVAIMATLCIAISFYESAANLFLFGALLVIFLDLIQSNSLHAGEWKRTIELLVYTAGILIGAIIGRTLVTRFTMHVFEIKDYFFRSVESAEWILSGDLRDIYVNAVMLIKKIVIDYFAVATVYYPITLFATATIVFIIFVLYMSVKRKNIWIGLYGAAVYVSLYALTIIQCDTLKYRSCQMFSIFVGLVMLMLTYIILKQRKYIKYAGLVIIALVIGYSAVDLNRWFIFDYEKNQEELRVVENIAEDLLVGGYDIENKEIVFVGDFELSDELLEPCYIKEGNTGWKIVDSAYKWMELGKDKYYFTQTLQPSLIDWCVEGLYGFGGYNKPMQRLFEYCGYSFKWADSHIYKELMPVYYDYYGEGYEYMKTELYSEEEQYPANGYIEERENCIVIKL